jgi:RHS repeat-associated protein
MHIDADQRYYNANVGRFYTADPYYGSVNLGDPGSWNRYAYANNDPVNRNDPRGLCDVVAGGIYRVIYK